MGHAQRYQSLLQLSFNLLGRLLAHLGKDVGLLLAGSCQFLAFGFQFGKGLVAVLDVVQLLLKLVAFGKEFLDSIHMILLLQVVDFIQTVVDAIQL